MPRKSAGRKSASPRKKKPGFRLGRDPMQTTPESSKNGVPPPAEGRNTVAVPPPDPPAPSAAPPPPPAPPSGVTPPPPPPGPPPAEPAPEAAPAAEPEDAAEEGGVFDVFGPETPPGEVPPPPPDGGAPPPPRPSGPSVSGTAERIDHGTTEDGVPRPRRERRKRKGEDDYLDLAELIVDLLEDGNHYVVWRIFRNRLDAEQFKLFYEASQRLDEKDRQRLVNAMADYLEEEQIQLGPTERLGLLLARFAAPRILSCVELDKMLRQRERDGAP